MRGLIEGLNLPIGLCTSPVMWWTPFLCGCQHAGWIPGTKGLVAGHGQSRDVCGWGNFSRAQLAVGLYAALYSKNVLFKLVKKRRTNKERYQCLCIGIEYGGLKNNKKSIPTCCQNPAKPAASCNNAYRWSANDSNEKTQPLLIWRKEKKASEFQTPNVPFTFIPGSFFGFHRKFQNMEKKQHTHSGEGHGAEHGNIRCIIAQIKLDFCSEMHA